jgi:hypothetical protein
MGFPKNVFFLADACRSPDDVCGNLWDETSFNSYIVCRETLLKDNFDSITIEMIGSPPPSGGDRRKAPLSLGTLSVT